MNLKQAFLEACFVDMRPVTHFPITTAVIALRIPFVVLMIVLAGCAMPDRLPDHAPESAPKVFVQVPEWTWLQVDSDIGAASLAASGQARGFARVQMEAWKKLVASKAETDFTPWFSNYWTQQWLTARAAWYKLNLPDDEELVVTRLAAYLQTQYRERVLAPVAKEIDPAAVRAQATEYYIQRLRVALQPIPLLHGVPPDQFDRRLREIPAIELAPPPAHNASLYQIVHAEPLDSLPAYLALLAQARKAAGGAGAGLSETAISPVARRVSEKLLERLAISGGSSAISALVGGVAASVISLGAASVGVILYESTREATDSVLRESLAAGTDEIWHSLMEDPASSVMAGIDYLSDQIEKCCPRTFAQPVEPAMPPEELPLPEEPASQPETIDGGASEENVDDDELSGFQTVD